MREGWAYKKLGDFIKEYSERDKGKGYPVYSVTNSKGFCQEFFGKNVASEDTSNYKVVPKGCFAYNPSRINVGSVACQNKEDYVSVSPLYVVFSVSSNLRQDYLLYYIKSNYAMTYINALSRGAVRNNLRLSTLKTFNIPVPTIQEQQQIVSELDMLSSVIEKQKAQIEELDKLAQSIFYDMFGDPVENEKGWEVRKLGEIISITSKLVDPNDEPYCNQYHVGPANIVSGTGEIVSCLYAKEENLISGKYAFKAGMVLYSKIRPNLNKVAIPTFDGICSADMYPLSVNDNAINTYIQQLLSSKEYLKYAVNCSGRARMPKINREALFDFEFSLPPLSLQQEFAQKIEAIESMKVKVRQSLKESEMLFNSRMDYYFN